MPKTTDFRIDITTDSFGFEISVVRLQIAFSSHMAQAPSHSQPISDTTTNGSVANGTSKSASEIEIKPKTEPKRGWWHSATREDCLVAEEKIIKEFVDLKRISYSSYDVVIDFDSKPQRIIDKEREELKRKSQSSLSSLSDSFMNLFKIDSKPQTETENNKKEEEEEKKEKENKTTDSTKNTNTCNNTCNNTTNNNEETQFIHTITFQLIKKSSSNKKNEKNEKNESKTDEKEAKAAKAAKQDTEKENENENETKEDLLDLDIILAHGYGAASCIFVTSINYIFDELISQCGNGDISKMYNIRIHLIDWLGCGLSSKPEFLCETTEETEIFFIDSLDKWRIKMGILPENTILAGHSIGGYCSAVYSLKYGFNINHLILLSPAAVPERPSIKELEDNFKNYPMRWRFLTRLIKDNGMTPFDIIRYAGPKGKALTLRLLEGRLNRSVLSKREDEKEFLNKFTPLMGEYMYQITHGGGSGEYCLNKIFTYNVYGQNPLYGRLGKLKKVMTHLKIDFIYGENGRDWMDSDAARKLRDNNIIDCNVYEIKDAGHQLFMENRQLFSKVFVGVVKNRWLTEKTEKTGKTQNTK